MAEKPPRRRWSALALGVTLALGPALLGVRAAVASFVDNSVAATATLGTAPDWVAPEVGATTIAKTEGYLAGSVRQGGTYFVYANVADAGDPASGVASEAADVSAISSSGSAVALTAGSYTAQGVAYNYRSAPLTAGSPLADGGYSYSIASTDAADNTRTQTGYTVTVDNTAPTPADVQTTNAGTLSRAEAGDTIVFTYSERIDPHSILAGWTGTSANVTVRLIDGGCLLSLLVKVCSNDSVALYDAAGTAALPLGTIDLKRDDYHGGGIIGTATPITFTSTMVQSGSVITVTLGTGSGTATTAGGSGQMVWLPSAGAYDRAGNAASTSSGTESGTNDRDF